MNQETTPALATHQQVLETTANQFCVVLNAEQQYSIWPLGMILPLGWFEVQPPVHGEQVACLNYIDRVWQDIRPASMRAA